MSNDETNPIGEFHKDTQAAKPDQQAAGRSAADDVIEKVGNLQRPKPKTKNGCPQCGNADIRVTRPLGSAPVHLCRSCGHKWTGGPRSPAKLVLARNGPTQTSVRGPYYRGSALRSDVDKHSPKSRTKSKSLRGLKEKLK